MNAPSARLHRVPNAGPDDVSGLVALVREGRLDPSSIVAILGKTEGNGCVNDFTRGFATRVLMDFLVAEIGATAAARVVLVMSGGTEGALSPHWLVFERIEQSGPVDAGIGGSLALGSAITRDLVPEEIGGMAQVQAVREGVVTAMVAAGIADPADVHFVQIKCPLLTSARIAEAAVRGKSCATTDTLKSMGLSRGASALGVALALGEHEAPAIDGRIGSDMSLYSTRASTSAGIELMGHEILILGMSAQWRGPLAIDHAVMGHAIDAEPVRAVMARLGIPGGAGFRALLAKAEASRSGIVVGSRHTMNDDSDISATRHARAFVAGVLAGIVGTTEIFVSGGAEHQGPDGGGPVAIIAERTLPAG